MTSNTARIAGSLAAVAAAVALSGGSAGADNSWKSEYKRTITFNDQQITVSCNALHAFHNLTEISSPERFSVLIAQESCAKQLRANSSD
jgi:hypothetical protein